MVIKGIGTIFVWLLMIPAEVDVTVTVTQYGSSHNGIHKKLWRLKDKQMREPVKPWLNLTLSFGVHKEELWQYMNDHNIYRYPRDVLIYLQSNPDRMKLFAATRNSLAKMYPQLWENMTFKKNIINEMETNRLEVYRKYISIGNEMVASPEHEFGGWQLCYAVHDQVFIYKDTNKSLEIGPVFPKSTLVREIWIGPGSGSPIPGLLLLFPGNGQTVLMAVAPGYIQSFLCLGQDGNSLLQRTASNAYECPTPLQLLNQTDFGFVVSGWLYLVSLDRDQVIRVNQSLLNTLDKEFKFKSFSAQKFFDFDDSVTITPTHNPNKFGMWKISIIILLGAMLAGVSCIPIMIGKKKSAQNKSDNRNRSNSNSKNKRPKKSNNNRKSSSTSGSNLRKQRRPTVSTMQPSSSRTIKNRHKQQRQDKDRNLSHRPTKVKSTQSNMTRIQSIKTNRTAKTKNMVPPFTTDDDNEVRIINFE